MSRLFNLGDINVGQHKAVIRASGGIRIVCRRLGKNVPPGRYNQRVAICSAAIRMRAALRRRDDKAASLDGAGAQQHMPVRAPAWKCKGRRHHDDAGPSLGKRAV